MWLFTIGAFSTICTTVARLAKGDKKPGWNKRAGMSRKDWEWAVAIYFYISIMLIAISLIKLGIDFGLIDVPNIGIIISALKFFFKPGIGSGLILLWNLKNFIIIFLD